MLGPGIGLDCTVIEFGESLLVAKSDPITFTAEDIGWYAVNVNANDVATTGARPRWFLATLLLPEASADEALADSIFEQIGTACARLGASLVGGHTEITADLGRPIVAGTMLGEVRRERLITPRGARPGDLLLLTKGVPIEGTSILAREFSHRLQGLPTEVMARARGFLHKPGISVVAEALAAADAGGVTAMHDPTEGGLAGGLWELAQAAGVSLEVDPGAVPILPEGRLLCRHLGLDPLATIASGALLLAVDERQAGTVSRAIEAVGVSVTQIGCVRRGSGVAMRTAAGLQTLPWPDRDAIAGLWQASPPPPGPSVPQADP